MNPVCCGVNIEGIRFKCIYALDSQIYKDALILQRVCLQTKLQLCEDEESVPDVQAAVQDMLSSLFTSVYNHQDDEGRCYSDSMAELPEHDEIDNKK